MKGFVVVALASLFGAVFCAPVGECPEKDPANPVYLPDDKLCTIYYECSNGVAVQNVCPDGLEFSPSKDVCVDPTISDCSAPGHATVTTPPPWTTTEPSVEFLDVVGTCPPRDTNITIYLPDSVNCTVYYVCSNGRPIALTCPGTQEFSPSLNVCVDYVDSDCAAHVSVRKPNGECPEKDPANPIYLPDTDDCTIYYECSNGEPVMNVCPPGQAFNPTLNVCDYPSHVQCKGSTSTEPSSTGSTSTEASTESTTSA